MNAAPFPGIVSLELPMRARSEPEYQLSCQDSQVLGVAFAGIHFEIEAPSALLALVSAVPQLCVLERHAREIPAAFPESGVSVHIRLRTLDASLPSLAGQALGARDIEWHWQGDAGRALTREARAQWQVLRSKLYAEGAIATSTRAAESLLTALASAALHRAGGAVLHAASVELPFGVVAFIGPSGAGKSTACRHVTAGKPFSIDRLAVLPAHAAVQRSWLAAPLPGGTGQAPPSELGSARGKPIALVLRVRHAKERTTLSECSRIEAVTALRASAFHAGTTAETESELLARLERLAGEVPVLHLGVKLGTPLEPLLREWVVARKLARAGASHAAQEGSQHASI